MQGQAQSVDRESCCYDGFFRTIIGASVSLMEQGSILKMTHQSSGILIILVEFEAESSGKFPRFPFEISSFFMSFSLLFEGSSYVVLCILRVKVVM